MTNMRIAGGVSRLRGGGCAAGFLLTTWAFLTRACSSTADASSASVFSPPKSRGEPTTVSGKSVSRLAFGSCNKQYLPQPMWTSVEDLSPDVWLWIGDAVYVDKFSDGGVEKMKEAFEEQLANEDYQRFLKKVPRVEGVWDDHDYGVNDAGKELSDHHGRVDAFLDFLGVGTEDPRRGGDTLYSSHVFGEAPRKVKVLMLDIRTQRDKYHAFNVAHRKFKFAGMLGAMLRWFSSSFCLGSDYEGSVIAEDQWDWLEEQLEDSDAAVHVLVSTLQVLTSNPLVESWGHFPRSRDRLLRLLRRTNPAGLVILSGDVHHAELASGWKADPPYPGGNPSPLPPGHPPISGGGGGGGGGGGCPFSTRKAPKQQPPATGEGHGREAAGSGFDAAAEDDTTAAGVGATASVATTRESSDESGGAGDEGIGSCAAHSAAAGPEGRGVVEVTTSGMTHSCLSTHGKAMCSAYLSRWRQHRWRDDAFFLDSNFGDIEIEWAEDENAAQPARMAITVRDTNGIPVLPVVEHFGGGIENANSFNGNPSESAAAAAAMGGEERWKPKQQQQEQQPERTFLDRSPPPECVEPVLPAGCTARKLSALAASVLASVLACVALARGARTWNRGRKTKNKAGLRPSTAVVSENGVGNGLRNGARNGS